MLAVLIALVVLATIIGSAVGGILVAIPIAVLAGAGAAVYQIRSLKGPKR